MATFRTRLSAAPLKLDTSREKHLPAVIAFRTRLSAAPLKRFSQGFLGVLLLTFRTRLSAAPLKPKVASRR